MKYIVVCGGSMSGLGKGIITSSIGALLKQSGNVVTFIKIDPYYNIDAGTITPYQHGEVYVLNDGGEVDLNLGNYQRFMKLKLTKDHNITSGKILLNVINKERKGQFLGQTVQIVPHITNMIADGVQEWIQNTAKIIVSFPQKLEPEICIIQIGGTIGDLENGNYFETVRQLYNKAFVSFIPILQESQFKTKPTQHGVRHLLQLGLQPDFIICRCQKQISQDIKVKIGKASNLPNDAVISAHYWQSIYEVPLLLDRQMLAFKIQQRLQLKQISPTLDKWTKFNDQFLSIQFAQQKKGLQAYAKDQNFTKIAIVGKYTDRPDAYMSVSKALQHSAMFIQKTKLKIQWIESTDLRPDQFDEKDHTDIQDCAAWSKLKTADGIIIPGGFRSRSIEGMIKAAQFARENKIPLFGICLGMQIAVIQFCRNVLNLPNATSQQIDKDATHKVIIYMPEIDTNIKGGNMRLGLKETRITSKTSLAYQMYNCQEMIQERHRHRYEVNPQYIDQIQAKGLIFTGHDLKKERMEICQYDKEKINHPFFYAVQYHPEFLSVPGEPSPPFRQFLKAAVESKSSE